MYFFLKILSCTKITQTESLVMMKKRSAKLMNFNHPKDRTSCPRAWPCKSYNENAPFLEKSSFLLIGMDQAGEI